MDNKLPFTLAESLAIQAKHLQQWKCKLNSQCYQDLEDYALQSNEGKTDPYSINRGCNLDNYVANWRRK